MWAKRDRVAMPDSFFERAAKRNGYEIVAGIDEVGRGPWAGPVYACAAVIDTRKIARHGLSPLDDSKKLNAAQRETLHARLIDCAQVGIGFCSVEEIDTLNILQASLLAMKRAVAALPVQPHYALVDGNKAPDLACPCETIIEGDAKSYSIAAASIVAKVTRDRLMVELAQSFPGYGWHTNMGYGTKEHQAGLAQHGVTIHHRKSWAPILNRLSQLTLDLRDVGLGESS
jgi:ribonuclease HII